MNAENLHSTAQNMLSDFSKNKINKHLGLVVEAFRGKVADPNNPVVQQSLETRIQSLVTVLLSLENNNYSSNWLHIVDEIGGSEFIGKNLIKEIETIISKNNLTPSLAHQTFSGILDRFNTFVNTLSTLVGSLKSLKIQTAELDNRIAEVGVIIPRKEVDNSLHKFGKEIIEINKIFCAFYEVITGSRESIKIRSISSSDLTIFLEFAPEVAAFTALTIERIISLYKNSLEIKILKSQLEEKNIPKKHITGIEEYSDSIMEGGLIEIIDDIADKYLKDEDDARKNELRVEIKHSLIKLAERIDKGYKIDIRIEPYLGNGNIEDEPAKEIANTILEASKNIRYDEIQGRQILNLPKLDNKIFDQE